MRREERRGEERRGEERRGEVRRRECNCVEYVEVLKSNVKVK